MTDFKSKRVIHHYSQTNNAAPEQVFPLLCPVREAEWAPGWKYRMIYSNSGIAELGCVFVTPNDDGTETTWIVTEYDRKAFRIAFAWVRTEMVATRIVIHLRAAGADDTRAEITYIYTGLSEQGNKLVDGYSEEWFTAMMREWEQAINAYLERQLSVKR